jgi:hypothetical protein
MVRVTAKSEVHGISKNSLSFNVYQARFSQNNPGHSMGPEPDKSRHSDTAFIDSYSAEKIDRDNRWNVKLSNS